MGTIRDINRLKKNAKMACELFMEECKRRGLAVLITETLRTKERQNELYEQGRTAPGKIVTWTKNSKHMTGLAWDICKNKKGEEYSDLKFFEECGMVLGDCWNFFGIMSVWCWYRFGIMWGWVLYNSGMVLGDCWNFFGIMLEWLWYNMGMDFE